MEDVSDILERTAAFAMQHAGDDCDRLLFNASKYPDIDVPLAVDTIRARARMARKVPEYASADGLLYPGRLGVEQCSSSACAGYKARLVSGLAGGGVVADITGGLGVDDYFMSFVAGRICSFERDGLLAACAEYNFGRLGRSNIEMRNMEVSSANLGSLLAELRPDLVYADPSRRGRAGGRVFAIRDYEPDISDLLPQVFRHCRYMIVKISPMEDIDAVFNAIPRCREIHAVASSGECKELLLVLDRDFPDVPAAGRMRFAVSLGAEKDDVMALTKEQEASACPRLVDSADEIRPGMTLYVPSAAIMKAGAYGLFAERYGCAKLDVSTHLYVGGNAVPGPAKAYSILGTYPFDRKGLSSLASRLQGRADVTARNLPVSSEELSKRLKIKSGGGFHVWGCRAAGRNVLLLTDA